ncbi:serine hydrolase domain-containing protein [Flavobacterium sp.]|uniref:serine hydrolase domain-containing protein n=1 Tax=Flavobacterium sp. TaxID=239 RepID=UPI0039E7175B
MGLRIFTILLLMVSFLGTAQKNAKDSLDLKLQQIYQQGSFNGFSVAVVNEKGILYENGIGWADVNLKRPYTSKTIQNIGSVSKTLVGIALLKAQELGRLKLDDPINQYLPFRVDNPNHPETPITIRHLASHTSTITDNGYYLQKNYILKPQQNLAGLVLELEDEQRLNPTDSVISMETYLKNVLTAQGKWYQKADFLTNKPGEIFEYSNVATALAAYVLERATGQPFNEFTKKYILKPLKMKASGWKFSEVDFSKYSRLYLSPEKGLPHYSLITYPDGNFITSAHDLGLYLNELIKGYNGHGKILSKESYREYFNPSLGAVHFVKRNEKNPYSDEYNIGVFIGFSYTGNIGHTGGDPGVASMLFFNPKTNIGRLLMVNTNINDKKGNDAFYGIWNALEQFQTQL